MEHQEFELVYREYAALIYRYLLSLGCPAQDAEDIAQDTFVKALLHIDSYRGECKLSVWLCQIAKNTWLTYRKKQNRSAPYEVEEQGLPDEHLCEWLDLVERLEEPYRSVFLKKTFGEYSYEVLAKQFGKSESWARVTYYRARQKLREMLGGD